ncbi:hypothetical protein R50073_42700 [Maricurvus nonylphenolicus]|uniref:MFS transporter n=1 Tax=Maricurvus nonylphenolicus TaxID=1008307 RepID=UPI0036F3540C
MNHSDTLQCIEKDNPREIVAAIVMGVVGLSHFLGMPVIAGALADGYGLTQSQLGYHAAIGVAGGILASVLVSVLVTRVNRQALLLLGLLIGGAANGSVVFAQDFYVLLGLAFLTGLGGGIVYALGIALLAGTHHTGKNFSLLMFSQGVFGGLELYCLPKIAAEYSAQGVFVSLTLAFLMVMPLSLLVSRYYQSEPEPVLADSGSSSRGLAPWFCLVSIFFFYLAVGSFWTYVERLGVGAGLGGETVSRFLTIGNFLALSGCVIAYWLSERVGQSKPLMLGLIAMALTFAFLSVELNAQIYLLGMLSFFLLWNFIDIFQLGTLSEIDHCGRRVALVPAFQAVGTALGPAASGWLLVRGWVLSDIMLIGSLSLVMLLCYSQRKFKAKINLLME